MSSWGFRRYSYDLFKVLSQHSPEEIREKQYKYLKGNSPPWTKNGTQKVGTLPVNHHIQFFFQSNDIFVVSTNNLAISVLEFPVFMFLGIFCLGTT
jgi:hypothetical protein